MEPQARPNWCWAATAKSTSVFYLPSSSWTQCTVANGALERSDCCDSGYYVACDVPWHLDSALMVTDNFVSMTGPLTNEQVIAELQAGRPLGARVAWSGGGGHFVVIYGYSFIMQVPRFTIADPIYGVQGTPTWSFANNYMGSGTWTHSYYTKANGP
jgi:hypothetical protein